MAPVLPERTPVMGIMSDLTPLPTHALPSPHLPIQILLVGELQPWSMGNYSPGVWADSKYGIFDVSKGVMVKLPGATVHQSQWGNSVFGIFLSFGSLNCKEMPVCA